MKKRYLSLLPAMALMAPLHADVKVETTLDKVAAKIDTDGTFLQLNNFDKDMSTMVEYGEFILDLVKEEERDIPEGLKVKDIIEILGVDQMKASAMSSKKVGDSWNNKTYLYTGGSDKGILSVYGKANEKNAVAEFAPETTDIAVQLRMDLGQAKDIITEIVEMVEMEDMVLPEMNKSQAEIGGMTPFEFISKMDVRVNLALDIDRENRIKPAPGADIPLGDLVARVDGAAWIWKLFGDQIIDESGLPWEKNESGKLITYTLPDEMHEQFMGYSPTIVVDGEKNFVWVASKESVLADARGGKAKTLKDGVAYKKTMATLPSTANSLVYISTDLLDELVHQYKNADKEGMLNDRDFRKAKPLVDKLITDLTSSTSGMAFVISKDDQGIMSVLRSPFPTKNYLSQVTPMLQSYMMLGMQSREMKMMMEGGF